MDVPKLKIVLVGEVGTGKSSPIDRYVNDTFYPIRNVTRLSILTSRTGKSLLMEHKWNWKYGIQVDWRSSALWIPNFIAELTAVYWCTMSCRWIRTKPSRFGKMKWLSTWMMLNFLSFWLAIKLMKTKDKLTRVRPENGVQSWISQLSNVQPKMEMASMQHLRPKLSLL